MVEFRSKLNKTKASAINRNAFKKALWVFVIIAGIFLFVGIISILAGEKESDHIMGVFLIILGVLITPLSCIPVYILQNSNDKTAKYVSDDTDEIFTLDEQYITITQTNGRGFSAKLETTYSYIYKANEDEKYYYLFLSKSQCYVIDKSSITQGTLREANRLLETHLGKKFRGR